MTARVRAGFCAVLVLVVMLVASLLAVETRPPSVSAQEEQPPATAPLEGEVLGPGSEVAVIKRICNSFGPDTTCDGRDTSLDGYSVDFNVFRGRTPIEPGEEPDDVVTVTLEQADGSQGKSVSDELVGTTYTVCEVPLATSPDGESVASGRGAATGCDLSIVESIRRSELPVVHHRATHQ